MLIKDVQKLIRCSSSLDRVFTLADLRLLYGDDSVATQFRKIEGLVKAGELVKVKKGIYARPDADLRGISQRIDAESVVSLGTVLAEEGLIGSIPGKRVWAVRIGRPRRYSCELGVIEHLSISPPLLFGWEWQNGCRRAVPEKAYLDAWYFHYKGRKLPFDLMEDVDVQRLDMGTVCAFLNKYERRFQTYLHSYLEGK